MKDAEDHLEQGGSRQAQAAGLLNSCTCCFSSWDYQQQASPCQKGLKEQHEVEKDVSVSAGFFILHGVSNKGK